MATLAEITQDVIELLHQVSGSSVQTYSQTIIENHVNKVFKTLHQKTWWPEYMRWSSGALDESTGVVTTGLVSGDEFMRWRDIRVIIPDGCDAGLPRLPQTTNPYELSGTTPLYVEPLNLSASNFATRIFRVWPLASTGTLYIHHRFRERENLNTTDEIYLDDDLVTYGAVWMYLKDDGTFPEMTQEYRGMFNQRYKDILKEDDDLKTEGRYLGQHQGSGGIPTRWFEDTI